MKKRQKIILDVVPLTRIPLFRSQSFSYLSDKKLGAGTLVSIPLFRRKVEGIVLGNRPDFPRLGNIELKNIGGVIEEKFLDEKQLELARFISDYYLAPLGIVLKGFIPKRVRAKVKNDALNIRRNVPKKIRLTAEQKWAVDEIAEKTAHQKTQAKNFYLFGPSGSGKTEVYINAISKLKTQNSNLQFLILLPELTLTPQAIERYGAYFQPEETVILNSKISKGEFYSSWNKIRSGEAKIIIGSRMAVFAPFKKLGFIVIDEEQDISFKQWDMNPRYDARTVAEKLAELHQAQIVFGSATPSIEYFSRVKRKKINIIELPSLKLPGKSYFQGPEVTVVDLRKERWQKNYSSISKKLRSEIGYALKNDLQIILFVNRQGLSNFSVCASCKNVLKCPRCDRALIYEGSGTYNCLHCSYKTSITPQCSKCNGLAFSNIGVGTQKVEREVAEIFPEAKIIRADGQTMKKMGAQKKMYQDFAQKKANILIGTQMISKGWDLPSVSLIGIIDADNLLSVPDFSANVRVYQNIVQISGRTGRPDSKFKGMVIIQTFNPDHPVIKTAAERDFSKLYLQEMRERKELQMPPFGKIIKLIFQDYDSAKVEKESQRIYLELLKKRGRQEIIYKPHSPLVSRIRGRFRKQIIVKIIKNNQNISGNIRRIFNFLPAGWIIDVDPISIV